MLTIRAPPWARIWGRHASVASHTPLAFTAIMRSHSSSVISSIGFMVTPSKMAALFTRTSMEPNASTAASAMATHDARSLTSTVTATARPPFSRIASATPSALSPLMSATTTLAPSSASAWA